MPKQLFLHIGMKKAASTTIQIFLQQNANRLARFGYFVPWSKTRRKQKELAYIFRKNTKYKVETDWEELHQAIASSGCNNVVISAEDFESIKESYVEAIRKELERYDVKIVVYLRRQDLRVESLYLQSVKTGVYTGSIQSYLAQHDDATLDYLLLLSTWEKYFGRENIVVRVLEKTQVPDVCIDFQKILGLNQDSDFQKLDGNRNVKPALEQMIAVKFLNDLIAQSIGKVGHGFFDLYRSHNFSTKYHIPLIKYTQHWDLTKSYKVLPCEKAKEILDKYKDSNKKVAQCYFDRVDGILFYENLDREYNVENLDIRNLRKEYLIDLCAYFLSIQIISQDKA